VDECKPLPQMLTMISAGTPYSRSTSLNSLLCLTSSSAPRSTRSRVTMFFKYFATVNQGLKFVHFSAQCQRFLSDRG